MFLLFLLFRGWFLLFQRKLNFFPVFPIIFKSWESIQWMDWIIQSQLSALLGILGMGRDSASCFCLLRLIPIPDFESFYPIFPGKFGAFQEGSAAVNSRGWGKPFQASWNVGGMRGNPFSCAGSTSSLPFYPGFGILEPIPVSVRDARSGIWSIK